MLGEKLKQLRESKGLLQRQIATLLDVDTAYICKMENNDKPVNRSYLSVFSKIYDVNEEELDKLWLADKLTQLVENENQALDALKLAQKDIKQKLKNNG